MDSPTQEPVQISQPGWHAEPVMGFGFLRNSHSYTTLSQWNKLIDRIGPEGRRSEIPLDGQSLDIATVVAVARLRSSWLKLHATSI